MCVWSIRVGGGPAGCMPSKLLSLAAAGGSFRDPLSPCPVSGLSALPLGPTRIDHRYAFSVLTRVTSALPMLALCQSVLQCPLVSESLSLQRHTALLSAPTVGSSPMSPWSPFPAPPSTARCQPCHTTHLATPSAIPPVALHLCISGPVHSAPE